MKDLYYWNVGYRKWMEWPKPTELSANLLRSLGNCTARVKA